MAINRDGTCPNLKSLDMLSGREEGKKRKQISAKISLQVKALSFEITATAVSRDS